MSPGHRRLIIALNATLTVLIAAVVSAGATIWLSRPAPSAAPVLAQGEALVTEPARARRVRYRLRKPSLRPHVVKADPAASSVGPPRTVRVIPIRRWPEWCDRIGGLEC